MKGDLSDRACLLALRLLQEYDGHVSTYFLINHIGTLELPLYSIACRLSGVHCTSLFGIVEIVAALIEISVPNRPVCPSLGGAPDRLRLIVCHLGVLGMTTSGNVRTGRTIGDYSPGAWTSCNSRAEIIQLQTNSFHIMRHHSCLPVPPGAPGVSPAGLRTVGNTAFCLFCRCTCSIETNGKILLLCYDNSLYLLRGGGGGFRYRVIFGG